MPKKIINYLSLLLGGALFLILGFTKNYSDLSISYNLIFLIIPVLIIYLATLTFDSKTTNQSLYLYLIIYLVFILNLILTNPIKRVTINGIDFLNYNIIPLQTIKEIILDYQKYGYGLDIIFKNFILLMPLSIIVPILKEKFQKIKYFLPFIISFSLGYEILSYILRVGVLDIDDVILRVLGAVFVFVIIWKTKLKNLLIKLFLNNDLKDLTFDINLKINKFNLKKKVKPLKLVNGIYYFLFIVFIFLVSNKVFALIDNYSLKDISISGTIKCEGEDRLILDYENYHYYTNCQGKYKIVFDNNDYDLISFIQSSNYKDSYQNKLNLRKKEIITDVSLQVNNKLGKKLIKSYQDTDIYFYNISSMQIKADNQVYDYETYLQEESDVNIDLYHLTKERYFDTKKHYQIRSSKYFNLLKCFDYYDKDSKELDYYLPINYKLTPNICYELSKS